MVEATLEQCNETELLWIAKRQGLGRLRRGLPHNVLVDIVKGEIDVTDDHRSGTMYTRSKLALFIHNPEEYQPDSKYEGNWERVRSQLPGCNGICTKFDCTEGRHILCYSPNVDAVG